MINTNELMLNNWVLHNDKPIKIAGMTKKYICYNSIKIITAKKEDIKPIRITKGILTKCGFKLSNGDYINEDGYSIYHFARYWHFDINLCSIPFLYLHQLQNLYFLITGKQLEINL